MDVEADPPTQCASMDVEIGYLTLLSTNRFEPKKSERAFLQLLLLSASGRKWTSCNYDKLDRSVTKREGG